MVWYQTSTLAEVVGWKIMWLLLLLGVGGISQGQSHAQGVWALDPRQIIGMGVTR